MAVPSHKDEDDWTVVGDVTVLLLVALTVGDVVWAVLVDLLAVLGPEEEQAARSAGCPLRLPVGSDACGWPGHRPRAKGHQRPADKPNREPKIGPKLV